MPTPSDILFASCTAVQSVFKQNKKMGWWSGICQWQTNTKSCVTVQICFLLIKFKGYILTALWCTCVWVCVRSHVSALWIGFQITMRLGTSLSCRTISLHPCNTHLSYALLWKVWRRLQTAQSKYCRFVSALISLDAWQRDHICRWRPQWLNLVKFPPSVLRVFIKPWQQSDPHHNGNEVKEVY